MNEEFYRQILNKQQQVQAIPSNKEITNWATDVIRLLYPEQAKKTFKSVKHLQDEFKKTGAGTVRYYGCYQGL